MDRWTRPFLSFYDTRVSIRMAAIDSIESHHVAGQRSRHDAGFSSGVPKNITSYGSFLLMRPSLCKFSSDISGSQIDIDNIATEKRSGQRNRIDITFRSTDQLKALLSFFDSDYFQ